MYETEQLFINEIAKNLDDDFPRLVYADWLQDHGDPRAEFIRVQCELAERMKQDVRQRYLLEQHAALLSRKDPELASLWERNDSLLRKYQGIWTRDLSTTKLKGYTFRRGFIDEVRITLTQFVRQARKLKKGAPLLSSLRITRVHESGLSVLSQCELLSQIRTLSLRNVNQSVTEITKFLNAPNLKQLASVDLSNTGLSWDLDWNWDFSNLKRLYLSGTSALSEGFQIRGRIFSESVLPLPQLEVLDLSYAGVTSALLEDMTLDSDLSRLEALNLSGYRLGMEGLSQLFESPTLTSLKLLVFNDSEIADSVLPLLLESECCAQLECLSLKGNEFSREAERKLKAHFGDVVQLD